MTKIQTKHLQLSRQLLTKVRKITLFVTFYVKIMDATFKALPVIETLGVGGDLSGYISTNVIPIISISGIIVFVCFLALIFFRAKSALQLDT